MEHLTFENLIIGGVVIVAIVFALKWLGVWDKLLGTAKEKANQAVDGATNAAEKARMQVRRLKPLLEQLGQSMTDLDGKYGKANGELTRAQASLETEKTGLQNVFAVLKDPKNLSADESTTVDNHKRKLREAAALVTAKQTEISGLAEQAKKLHDQYAEAEEQFNAALANIPLVEARQVVIDSKNVAVAFGKKQAEYAEAAKMGTDINSQLDEAEAKADAELKRTGTTKTDTEKAAEKAAKSKTDGDLFKDLGIEDPTAK